MSRNSALNERHLALGTDFSAVIWNDMPLPWDYSSKLQDEVIATRNAAALYDVSSLNSVVVSGPDAESVLDQLVCIDLTKLQPGTSRLSAEVDENGGICDDIMVIRDAPDVFRLSHGSGKTPEHLAKLAAGKNVKVLKDLDAHVLSLQGPKSLEVLAPHVGFKLADLLYFKHVNTTIFGCDVVIARGGYSGEQGYEIYCKAKDAVLIWDKVLEVGAAFGVIPASWHALEVTRMEAALMFFPFEMCEGDTTPWEINMGWGVDIDKAGDYIGKQAVLASRGKERFKLAGMVINMPGKAPASGDKIYQDGKEVGIITSAIFSEYLMLSLALAHLSKETAVIGTELEIKSDGASYSGRVSPTPFYDPMRLRTHPEKLLA